MTSLGTPQMQHNGVTLIPTLSGLLMIAETFGSL
jgi:hypothetical protein